MKKLLSLVTFSLFAMQLSAQNNQPDYRLYHTGIIDAEQSIFIDNNPGKGLGTFKNTFAQYDFVWVDDCLEAFQLALFYKRDDMAMIFIKKALDNGFELKLLDLLSLGCPCNYYRDRDIHVSIYKEFISKNKAILESYAEKVYPKYLQRINKTAFYHIIRRNVEEQLFKNYVPGLESSQKVQEMVYGKVCENNLRYMDSLAQQHIFVGERLLGIYTDKLADSLKLVFASKERFKNYLLKRYKLPSNTPVPIPYETSYFDIGAAYNMLFHNKNSYQTLLKYSDEAIRLGYWHPREFYSLRFNNMRLHTPDSIEIHLETYWREIPDTKKINEQRKRQLLPSYEIDHAKHFFAEKNHLQLFFGFFNGTR